MNPAIGTQEKNSAALNSVAAAFLLTGLKVVVGLLSGSLGILAEAAHSGLDCAAAIVTYIAVRAASKPADRDHAYGHGKVENLSALVETLLLLATCAWIIRESVLRLTSHHVQVDASIWAFAVMGISIAVDVSRSRMLYRVAAKHRSQALEADALHFSTDIWSSAVVILGLLGVRLAGWYPGLGVLVQADAVAALMVAGIVVVVSGRLGLRTVQALLDSSPPGVDERIRVAVAAMDGVFDCHAVRVRHSGPDYFVDLHITVDGEQSLRAAHALTERVEQAVEAILPGADVTVHPEPAPAPPQVPARLAQHRSKLILTPARVGSLPYKLSGFAAEPPGLSRHLFSRQPYVSDLVNQYLQFLEFGWFGRVGVRAQLQGAADVRAKGGPGQDDHRQGLRGWVGPDPFQHLEAVETRHFQVEQYQIRERMFFAIGEVSRAAQVSDSLLAIGGVLQGKWRPAFPAGELEQCKVIRIVLDIEDGLRRAMAAMHSR